MVLACGEKWNRFAGRRRLVAQPGGLTLGFVLHLVAAAGRRYLVSSRWCDSWKWRSVVVSRREHLAFTASLSSASSAAAPSAVEPSHDRSPTDLVLSRSTSRLPVPPSVQLSDASALVHVYITTTTTTTTTMNEWMNILLINIHYSKNSKKQNCVDWTERLKEHLQLR